MRKRFSKIAAIAATAMLSLTTVFSGTVICAYATDVTITSQDNETHTYAAYKIFSGDVTTTDGNKVLTGIAWADETAGASILTALQAETTFGSDGENAFYSCTTAADVAQVMGTITDSDKTAKLAQIIGANLPKTATATSTDDTIANLGAGYYLIKDNTAVTGNGASTLYILEVVGEESLTVDAKTAIPTLEKKVLEDDYSNDKDEDTTKYGENYNDVADYSESEEISLRIYGTLPNNYDDYDTYYYQFVDTESTGITLVGTGTDNEITNSDVTVSVWNTDEAGNVTVSKITSGYTVTDTTADGVPSFTVTFEDLKKAVVSDSATIDENSKIVVEYKAVLDSDAIVGNPGNVSSAYLVYSNNPNDDATADKGTTPEDQVVIVTYQLKITKTDGATEDTLSGVKFVLKNAEGKYVTVDKNNYVTGTADSTDKSNTIIITGTNGVAAVIGLEDGTYTLVEYEALEGYNVIDDEKLVITASILETQTWSGNDPITQLEYSVDNSETTTSNDKATVEIAVKNFKGTVLPTTGGMGTTVLYIIGGVMICGAGIVLVVRRRVKNETSK